MTPQCLIVILRGLRPEESRAGRSLLIFGKLLLPPAKLHPAQPGIRKILREKTTVPAPGTEPDIGKYVENFSIPFSHLPLFDLRG